MINLRFSSFSYLNNFLYFNSARVFLQYVNNIYVNKKTQHTRQSSRPVKNYFGWAAKGFFD